MGIGIGFSGGGGLTKPQKDTVTALSNNFRGMFKPYGCQTTVYEAYGASSVVSKIEAEAPFSRVRIWVWNRGAYGYGGWKFAVAATDKYAVDTNTNAYIPQYSGTTNNSIQTTASTIGWVVATWGGSGYAHGGFQASNAMYRGESSSGKIYPSYDYPQSWQQSKTDQAVCSPICSDWIQIRSRTPNPVQPSGYARPFLLLRTYRNTGSFPIEGTSAHERLAATVLTAYSNWTGGNNTYRLHYTRAYTGGDGVATPTLMPSTVGEPSGATDENYPYIGVEFEYDIPTRAFAIIGDSNSEGYQWHVEAIRYVSVPTRPITSANFGMSSNRSIQYLSQFDQVFKKGARFTDWLVPSHSANDVNDTDFDLDQTKVQMQRILDEADSLGVTVWIWTYWRGINTGFSANDAQIEEYLEWIRDICTQGRAKLVDIAANWSRASYTVDSNVHPNATGIAYCKSVFISALSANL